MSGPPPHQRGGDGSRPTSTRQLLRQQRELEEKRKFGLAPLAVDTVSNKEISPNIPQSIAQAPWYYGAAGPTLDHQRKHQEHGEANQDLVLQDNTDKMIALGQAHRFVAGACKNCGSRTHKTKECTQAKKKVGANFTNRVTGEDLLLQRAKRTDGQKRDRFVSDGGVDLLRGQQQQSEEANTEGNDGNSGKRSKPEGIFNSRSAQHGGVEIQELPKYLQNLDQQDDIFFDPKTGSMRGNPNANDPTKAFQGDLARYRSGDFYNYVEAQHRYLTGKSKSFVDFELDKEMNAEKGVTVADGEGGDGEKKVSTTASPADAAHDALVHALYGETGTAIPIARTTTASFATKTAPEPLQGSSLSVKSAAVVPESASPASLVHDKLVKLTASSATANNNSGHRAVYGSYLDPVSLRWGYSCCKAAGKDAPRCVSPARDTKT